MRSVGRDGVVELVYPRGSTLNVQEPALPILTSGFVSYPLNRPIGAVSVSKVGDCPPCKRGTGHLGAREGGGTASFLPCMASDVCLRVQCSTHRAPPPPTHTHIWLTPVQRSVWLVPACASLALVALHVTWPPNGAWVGSAVTQKSGGRIAVLGSAEMFADDWLSKEHNAKLEVNPLSPTHPHHPSTPTTLCTWPRPPPPPHSVLRPSFAGCYLRLRTYLYTSECTVSELAGGFCRGSRTPPTRAHSCPLSLPPPLLLTTTTICRARTHCSGG